MTGMQERQDWRLTLRRLLWSIPRRGGRPVRGSRRWVYSSAGEHYLDMVGVTGSIPVAPTTQSYPNRKSQRRLWIGRFCGDFRWYRSALSVSGDTLRSLSPILASRLCIQKFRSRVRVCDLRSRSAIGSFWGIGAKSDVSNPIHIYCGFNPRALNC